MTIWHVGLVPVKVPQILKIWRANSGEGISLAGVLLDLSAITANVAYSFVLGYPFRWVGRSRNFGGKLAALIARGAWPRPPLAPLAPLAANGVGIARAWPARPWRTGVTASRAVMLSRAGRGSGVRTGARPPHGSSARRRHARVGPSPRTLSLGVSRRHVFQVGGA